MEELEGRGRSEAQARNREQALPLPFFRSRSPLDGTRSPPLQRPTNDESADFSYGGATSESEMGDDPPKRVHKKALSMAPPKALPKAQKKRPIIATKPSGHQKKVTKRAAPDAFGFADLVSDDLNFG